MKILLGKQYGFSEVLHFPFAMHTRLGIPRMKNFSLIHSKVRTVPTGNRLCFCLAFKTSEVLRCSSGVASIPIQDIILEWLGFPGSLHPIERDL